MRLTSKKAIEISIELWTWLAETGEKFKKDWPGWDKRGQYEGMVSTCPLCDYSNRKNIVAEDCCVSCPYYKVFGYCLDEGMPYDKWESSLTEMTRKKYASLFLEQLRQL